jgi:hypothetical protein
MPNSKPSRNAEHLPNAQLSQASSPKIAHSIPRRPKLKSVAFPLIGCGRFRLDEKMLILQFLNAIEEFDDRLPEGESLHVWLVIRDRDQFESVAGTFLDLLMQARSKLVLVRMKQSGVSILDRFASRLLERTNEGWAKWQLCRYAEVATEVMCYAISRATKPATSPEAVFDEGRPARFGQFLEKARRFAGKADLDSSAWGVHFFSHVLKDTKSVHALEKINSERNNLAHGRKSLPLVEIKKLVAQGLKTERWKQITETDGELQLAHWRPWVGMSGADQIGLLERWQKNTLRYLVPETGEVFNIPRCSS